MCLAILCLVFSGGKDGKKGGNCVWPADGWRPFGLVFLPTDVHGWTRINAPSA